MNFVDMSDADILAIANPIMDNLMEASTRIDHEAHIRDFSDRMKKIVVKEHLQQVCRRYQAEKGFFADRHPIAVLNDLNRQPSFGNSDLAKPRVTLWRKWYWFITMVGISATMSW